MATLKGKKVLVTGAGGFIGSHLVEALVAEGASVRAMVRYNSLGHWGMIEELAPDVRSAIEVVRGDVCDLPFVAKAVKGRDVVFHLAALIAIPYSYEAAASYVSTNVQGTLNVLQAALDAGVPRVVHTSTSEIYGTAQYVPIDEKHPINPQSPYAATKAGADWLALTFHRSFDLGVSVLRPFNTFGPRQSARAIVPTIITQALAREEIALGNADAIRDLTFVKDTARGFIANALSDSSVGRVVHLGTGTGVSVADLAKTITGLLGVSRKITFGCAERMRPEKSEVERLISSPAEALAVMQWRPTTSLDDGLRQTVEYVRAHLDRYKPDLYNV